ncbi:Aste57867_5611 [Aphanomyces stellatus]|uniref:Aste57867_5611 protein n=1 Tax=Aphanomyces stellatus TaxID=120398 RepID=A0A485KEP9_9STRA|nr:hypothetical protein As57867_005598 [Aphanomyces stellatus]VFT82657.1 Aste57867_5611 [Aphanomyces stellatus]
MGKAEKPSAAESTSGIDLLTAKWSNAKKVAAFDSALVSQIYSTYLTADAGKQSAHALSVLDSTGYLEHYLWPHFTVAHADKALLLSIVVLSNVKEGRAWASVDAAKFASFVDALLRLKIKTPTLTLREQAHLLRFLMHSIRQLENESVAKTMLKYTSLPVWKHLSDIQRNLVFADHPKLKRHWQNRQAAASKATATPSSPVAKKRKTDALSDEIEGDVYPLLLKDLKDVLTATPEDDRDGSAAHYVAHALDLWIDLMSQLPTRRFLRTLVLHQHLLMACRHSALVKNHPLLAKQVDLLHFYVHFPIDDQTGHAWTATEHKNELATRVHALQVAAFERDPALHALSLLPMSALSNRAVLETTLALIPDDVLYPFAISVGLIQPSDENVDMVDCFMDRFALYTPPTLPSLPMFPTETDIWAPEMASLDGVLSTRKLNLQFLSLTDYLIRNYELYRLEAAYGVRVDLEHVLAALDATTGGPRRAVFRRRHKMAAAVDTVKIVRVDQPAIGELHPAQVVAQITLDMPPEAIPEWDALQPTDVLFLVWLAPNDGDVDASSLTFAEAHGVHGVRGAQLLQVLDGHGTAIGQLLETGERAVGRGTRRVLRVALDGAQYAKDVADGATDVYTNINVVVRRESKVNNFKAVLGAMKDVLREQKMQHVLPSWLHDVFLGYGDPAAAHFTRLDTAVDAARLFDTFVDGQHALDSFRGRHKSVSLVDATSGKPIHDPSQAVGPFTVTTHKAKDAVVIQASTIATNAAVAGTAVQFTPAQVDAIHSAMHPGLTVVVGPPGTGKTDVAVQLVSNLYQAHPAQRIVIVTHANQALNDFFDKILAKGVVDPGHLLRLGAGEKELSDFSKDGRVEYLLARRALLLDQVEHLAVALGGPAAACGASHSCAQAAFFYTRYLVPALDTPGDHQAYLKTFSHATEKAGVAAYVARLFAELADLSALEVLRTPKQRGDFLLIKHARVIAMTCTQAALSRERFIAMGFAYSTLVMEEASQVSEIESLVPMLLQSKPALERVVLLGDHLQLPPVVQNIPLKQFSKLDQSLFTRCVRLGVPLVQLDQQGRTRPSIAALYKWKYKNLTDLDRVTQLPEFKTANAGFRHTFQFIDVAGGSEVSPRPQAYENHLEAMYIVQVFQYMRLVGYPADRITVLTTYNGQKELLLSMFQPGKAQFGLPARVATVDQYQGQQNDFVLLSLVRTRHVGHLRDPRRAIVAVSRARLGLYVFGKQALFGSCVDLTQVMTPLCHATALELVPSERVGAVTRTETDKKDADTQVVSNAKHMGEVVAKMKSEAA